MVIGDESGKIWTFILQKHFVVKMDNRLHYVRRHSHCTIFCDRVNARAEIRHTDPLQCSDCRIFLQSEHCKRLVWRISARAFTRLQKIVQCECSLSLTSSVKRAHKRRGTRLCDKRLKDNGLGG